MIIVKLLGGHGNQMFQYALGKALSLDRKTKLKLDISYFEAEGTPRRKYSLDIFNLSEEFATAEERKAYQPPTNALINASPKLQRLVANLSPHYVNEYYTHGFIPENTRDLYLEGNWQSEDYFGKYQQIIRSAFSFKARPSSKVAKWLEKIKQANAVSIHVRRTDYVHRSKTQKPIPGCTLSYYCRAIKFITTQVKAPVFFVFSDDPDWAKKHIHYPKHRFFYPSFLPEDDLRLISSCKHHIIANSSFSWWGAWLNPSRKKVVIAPKPWFEEPINHYHPIVPQDWVQIPKQ